MVSFCIMKLFKSMNTGNDVLRPYNNAIMNKSGVSLSLVET